MELWQLRTLVATAETLNFTKASDVLNLTQSAVSHQIKALEEELGTPLLYSCQPGRPAYRCRPARLRPRQADRSGRRGYGTRRRPTGKGTRRHGPRSRRDSSPRLSLRSAVRRVYGFASVRRTRLSHDHQHRANRHWHPRRIDRRRLRIACGLFARPRVHADLRGRTDARRRQKASARKKSIVRIDDIRDERWILFERGASIRRATDAFFKEAGMVPEKALESNDTYFIKLMIERGLGISLMPGWSVKEEVEAGELSRLRIKDHKLVRSVSMASLKGSRSAAIDAFIRFMSDNKEVLRKKAAA